MPETYNLYEYKFDDGYIKFYASQDPSKGYQLKILFSSIEIKTKDGKYIDGIHYLNSPVDYKTILPDYINFQNVLYQYFHGYNLYSNNIYNKKKTNPIIIPKGKLSFFDLHEIAQKLRSELSDDLILLLSRHKSIGKARVHFNDFSSELEIRDFHELFDFSQILDKSAMIEETDKKYRYWVWRSDKLNSYTRVPDEIDLLSFMELVVSHFFKTREEIEKIKFTKKI